jgi:hypothetical protein
VKSSLGGHNVDHTTTGAHNRRAIPRAEGTPLDDTYRPTRWPNPTPVREWKFDEMKRIHLGALSPGDYFTTTLTHRRGWVLAQGRIDVSEQETRETTVGIFVRKDKVQGPLEMRPVTRVEWEGFEGAPGTESNLSPSVLVISGWWEVTP